MTNAEIKALAETLTPLLKRWDQILGCWPEHEYEGYALWRWLSTGAPIGETELEAYEHAGETVSWEQWCADADQAKAAWTAAVSHLASTEKP